jgi:hypothetical protein
MYRTLIALILVFLGGAWPAPAQAQGRTVFGIIQGSVLDSAGRPLADSRVRLRDCRLGRLAAISTSDRLGVVSFNSVEPGTYVIELLNGRDDVVAASDLLTVNAGETATGVVKLPAAPLGVARAFGRSLGEAAGVIAAAASTGVLASTVTGDDVSPR